MNQEVSFGVRTIEGGTARLNDDYVPIDIEFTMKPRENEVKVEVKIVDNNEWEPDMDFWVEIYDVDTKKKLYGDDTKTVVTILDEDFPGTLSFDNTEIKVSKKSEKIEVKIMRNDGSDGEIQCTIRTQPLSEKTGAPNNAVEFEDYLPKHEKVIFEHGETEKTIQILIMNEKVP